MTPEEWLESLNEAIVGAQARNLAHQHILRDIVIQIAKGQPDPQRYVSDMFSRITSTVEQGEDIGNPVHAELSQVLDGFFSQASVAVRPKE